MLRPGGLSVFEVEAGREESRHGGGAEVGGADDVKLSRASMGFPAASCPALLT